MLVASGATTAHSAVGSGGVVASAESAGRPKSMTRPTRFWPVSAGVAAQICSKVGASSFWMASNEVELSRIRLRSSRLASTVSKVLSAMRKSWVARERAAAICSRCWAR